MTEASSSRECCTTSNPKASLYHLARTVHQQTRLPKRGSNESTKSRCTLVTVYMAVASVIHAYETLISRGLRALRCSHDAVYGVFRKYEAEYESRKLCRFPSIFIGFHRLKRLRFGDENENENESGRRKEGRDERSERNRVERDLLARNNYSTIKEDPFYRNTQYTVVTQRRCARLSCPLLSEKVGQDFHTGQTRRRLALVPGGIGYEIARGGEGPVSSPVFFRPVPLCKL